MQATAPVSSNNTPQGEISPQVVERLFGAMNEIHQTTNKQIQELREKMNASNRGGGGQESIPSERVANQPSSSGREVRGTPGVVGDPRDNDIEMHDTNGLRIFKLKTTAKTTTMATGGDPSLMIWGPDLGGV